MRGAAHLALLIAVAAAPLAVAFADKAPAPDAQPKVLVGTWGATGQVPNKDGSPGMTWKIDYVLAADGSFKMQGYPPISVSGRWAVSERNGRKLRIVLSQQKMGSDSWPDKDAWGELSSDGKTLTWQDKTFRKK